MTRLNRLKMATATGLAIYAAAFSGSSLAQDAVVMRVANVTPDSHPSAIVLHRVAERLNSREDVELEVQVFSGGVLGGELETLDQMTRGAIEGVVSQAISLYQMHSPEFGVEELPFLFPSREVAYSAVDGEFGSAISDRLEEYGYQVLAYWENGYRNFTNSRRPIVKPEDMAGLRFRSAESPIRLDMFEALGASAVAMPFPELYAALQQKVVDGQENPLTLIANAGFDNVQNYVSLSGHIWNAAPVVVSTAWWQRLSEDARAAIQEEFQKGRIEQRELVAAGDHELIEVLRDRGMEINEVDTAAFQAVTDEVWNNWEDRIGTQLMNLAREIRDGEVD